MKSKLSVFLTMGILSLLFIILLFIFTAPDTPSTKPLLAKSTHKQGDYTGTTHFTYNDSGALIDKKHFDLVSTTGNQKVTEETFRYNEKQQIQSSKVTEYYIKASGELIGRQYTLYHTHYTYREGKVSEYIETEANGELLTKYSYTYNQQGLPVQLQISGQYISAPWNRFQELQYDKNGNLIRKRIYRKNLETGEERELITFSFEYDDKVNPKAYVRQPSLLPAPKNNVITHKRFSSPGSVDRYRSYRIEYEYNEFDMPVKEKRYAISSTKSAPESQFEYEYFIEKDSAESQENQPVKQ